MGNGTSKIARSLWAGAALLGSVVAGTWYAEASHYQAKAAPNASVDYNINNPFLNKIAGPAVSLAGSNDLYASVLMAQAALESGYGTSALAQAPNNNLFGVKGYYNGQSLNKDTLEDDGSGVYHHTTARFRRYPNVEASLADYVRLIKGGTSWDPNYYAGVWKSNTRSYRDATAALVGTYATDTRYAGKLNRVIEMYDLTRFDNSDAATALAKAKGPQAAGRPTSAVKPSHRQSYTVKPGDGLWAASRALGISIERIKEINGLSSDLIFPGQVLYGQVSETKVVKHSLDELEHVVNDGSKPAQTATAKHSGRKSYTVKAGDGLWTVARALGVSIEQVKRANGLSSNLIFPGQVLYADAASDTDFTPFVLLADHSADLADAEPAETAVIATHPQQADAKHYTVKSGDTLWRIARDNGLSLDELRALNHRTGNALYVGEVLTVSGAPQAAVEPEPTAAKPTATTYEATPQTDASKPAPKRQTYQVKAGDNLYRIALNHGVSLADLVKANGFSSSAALIVPGQVLVIPA